ncbi:alpha-amylase family glycosyl hydrolase [Croceiramulus getboli]|nr:alpha-amylase family glycosyl hydrolase [Flavobacteriaceae bacterium YJPT1-3]
MKKYLTIISAWLVVLSCAEPQKPQQKDTSMNGKEKKVVYQVFTRLFGNTNTTNKPWGTIAENGVGKFNDFTDQALKEIKDLGVTHIWYTGVPHHAVINDYTKIGIPNDDPDVVKGRAGSPYAVKDYYQVNPDLAEDPANRMAEFEALIARTHANGLQLLIDIVPNHVARKYEGKNNPEGVSDFGAQDDTSVVYARDNNFYYIPGEDFKVPAWPQGYQPLGGEAHEMIDGRFRESPAKWTGNGSRDAQPNVNDWYETVKINYGVRPDGSYDFPALPEGADSLSVEEHYAFWQDQDVPDSWKKFKDIALFWTEKGVDGFRFDMAEMVPVGFWSYMNSHIKNSNPEAFLLAEVYNPSLYRDYIHRGKMDYLYDKVALYDSLKYIMQGHSSTDRIAPILEEQRDIEHHLLHFLENHDEQRIASPEFAGDVNKAKPAMVVSALTTTSPTMIYFGQEVGEPGAEDGGFGDPSRTSIFDYVGVPAHQRWMNEGAFDGGQSTDEEKALRDFYKRLLKLSLEHKAFEGEYADIHQHNRQNTEWYNDKVYSFVRWNGDQRVVVVSNFDAQDAFGFELQIPAAVINDLGLEDGNYKASELLRGEQQAQLRVESGTGFIRIDVAPLASVVYVF